MSGALPNKLLQPIARSRAPAERQRWAVTNSWGVPNKTPVRHVVQVLLVLALLVMIVNPELRVVVLFADSLGLELVVLLLTLQLRSASCSNGSYGSLTDNLACSTPRIPALPSPRLRSVNGASA